MRRSVACCEVWKGMTSYCHLKGVVRFVKYDQTDSLVFQLRRVALDPSAEQTQEATQVSSKTCSEVATLTDRRSSGLQTYESTVGLSNACNNCKKRWLNTDWPG